MSPIAALVLSFTLFPIGIYFIYRGCKQEYEYAPLMVMLKNACFTSGAISILIGLIGVIIVLSHSTIGRGDLVVILDDGDKVVDVPQRIRWLSHCRAISLTREAQAKASVQPITDNPKVRRLELTVDTEIVDASRFVESMNIKAGSKCIDDNGHNQDCAQRDATLFCLYEFMNSHSRELGKFYNPYDPQQTRDLEALMHANLDESLTAKGLRLTKLVKWTTE